MLNRAVALDRVSKRSASYLWMMPTLFRRSSHTPSPWKSFASGRGRIVSSVRLAAGRFKRYVGYQYGQPTSGLEQLVRNEPRNSLDQPLLLDDGLRRSLSRTTFVLPFWYCLVKPKGPQPHSLGRYTADPAGGQDARRYFSEETSDSLYEFSRRFRLSGDREDRVWRTADWRSSASPHKEGTEPRTIRTEFEYPQVVLFEWPTAISRAKEKREAADDHSRAHLLELGFLVLRTRLIGVGNDPASFPTLDDQLLFNERFRYLRGDHSGWWKSDNAVAGVWPSLLGEAANAPSTRCCTMAESWGRELFEGWSGLLRIPLECDEEFFRLFPGEWEDGACQWLQGENASWQSWIAYPDHRAFTWTAVVLDEDDSAIKPEQLQLAEQFSTWRRLLNVDEGDRRGESALPSKFDLDWTRDRTFYRWASGGTYYGFCGHAGAMLIRFGSKAPAHLVSVFETIYLDMQLLLLYDRSIAFSLSGRLARLARERWTGIPRPADDERQREDANLRDALDYFSNVYRFPLISNQQQAIELYTIARRALDVDVLVAEVETKVRAWDDNLEAEATMEAGKQQVELAQTAVRLTTVATLLGASVAAGPLAYVLGDYLIKGNAISSLKQLLAISLVFLLLLFLILFLVHWTRNPFVKLTSHLGKTMGIGMQKKKATLRLPPAPMKTPTPQMPKSEGVKP